MIFSEARMPPSTYQIACEFNLEFQSIAAENLDDLLIVERDGVALEVLHFTRVGLILFVAAGHRIGRDVIDAFLNGPCVF